MDVSHLIPEDRNVYPASKVAPQQSRTRPDVAHRRAGRCLGDFVQVLVVMTKGDDQTAGESGVVVQPDVAGFQTGQRDPQGEVALVASPRVDRSAVATARAYLAAASVSRH